MKEFAKIIQLPQTQFLVFKDEDEDGGPCITMVFNISDIGVKSSVGYNKDDKRDTEFEKFDKETALSFYLSFKSLITDPT